MQSAVHCYSCHHCFLKEKKVMENAIFFTRHEKEIRELDMKVLEARVKHLYSCCTVRKEYNLNFLFRFFQAIKTSNIGTSGALSTSIKECI
jgi:hypothetical protein